MSKRIYEGCGAARFCDDPCKSDHQRKYDPKTKEVSMCPAYYRFTIEKKRVDMGRGGYNKKKKEKFVKVELR